VFILGIGLLVAIAIRVDQVIRAKKEEAVRVQVATIVAQVVQAMTLVRLVRASIVLIFDVGK